MKSISLREEYGLILGWVLATLIGVVLSKEFFTTHVRTAIIMIFHLDEFSLGRFTVLFVYEVTTGILVGLLQWLILRTRLSHNLWWVFVTPLGMFLGRYLSSLFSVLASHLFQLTIWPVDLWLSRFLYGVVIGLGQWLVLRKSVSKSWTWLIANGLSWSLAITISAEFIRPSIYGYFGWSGTPFVLINTYYEIVIYGSLGILVGIITGIHLQQLLKRQSVMIQTAA